MKKRLIIFLVWERSNGGVINIITHHGGSNFLRVSTESGRYIGNEISEDTYSQQVSAADGYFQPSWNTQLNIHEEQSGQRTGLRDTEIFNMDIDTQYSWHKAAIEWIAGAHYYRDSITQETVQAEVDVDDETRDGTEVFIHGDWYATKNWEITVGLRAQNDSGYGG